MRKFIKDILTGLDGETYDTAKAAMWFGIFGQVGLSGYHIYKGLSIDFLAWGSGFAAILAAAGVAIKLKEKSEPGLAPTSNTAREPGQ